MGFSVQGRHLRLGMRVGGSKWFQQDPRLLFYGNKFMSFYGEGVHGVAVKGAVRWWRSDRRGEWYKATNEEKCSLGVFPSLRAAMDAVEADVVEAELAAQVYREEAERRYRRGRRHG
jgi:hypothetical protein